MPSYPLTNFEIQKYYENEPKFNDVYLRNNLSKIMDGAYIIALDECKSIRTHSISLFVNDNNITYIDSFGVEHIPKKIRKFIRNKNVATNIYRVKTYDSIMCGCFCIRFIDCILKSKRLLECKNSFSPNGYQKNGKIISKYFQ